MKEELQYTTLLVDLDSILDTRLSLLIQTFPDRIEDILSMYFARGCNDFPGIIGYRDFNNLYLNRDRSVLHNATMTSIPIILRDFTESTIDSMVSNGIPVPPRIFLNIHPYDLDEKEIKVIINALLFHLDKRVDIEVVNLGHKDITYSYLFKNIWGYIKFDYYNWLDDLTPLLSDENERCPDVKLITPAYFPMEHKDLNKIFFKDGKKIDPFNIFSLGMKYIIDIDFVRPSLFNRAIAGDPNNIDDIELDDTETNIETNNT